MSQVTISEAILLYIFLYLHTQTDIIKVLTDLKINNNISNRLLNGLLLKKYK